MTQRTHTITTTLLLTACLAAAAHAVQVQDLVRLKGAESSKLVGMGLVVGLNGTGDGGKFLPAMRPLASVIQQFIDPGVVAAELKDAKNVALVAISATLPGSGVREGDSINVSVSTVGPASSLEGGRLFLIPLTGPLPNAPVYAFAEGPVSIENMANPTTGVVVRGAQLTRDVMSRYIDRYGRITLVLDEANASWPTANNLANLVNGVIAPEGPNVAKALDQKNVLIDVPIYERSDPAAFISQILQSYVDPSQIGTGARVVINEKTGTIIVSGEVQISPVIISHKGLTITAISPPVEPSAANRTIEQNSFVSLDPEKRADSSLSDLLNAFNQLKVDAQDRIAIIKEIHRSGKLHAKLIVQ